MDEIAAPGILAYKAGECFVNLVSLINEIPAGRDINSTTIEILLQQYAMSLSPLSRFTTDIWLGIGFSFNVFPMFSRSGIYRRIHQHLQHCEESAAAAAVRSV